MSETTETKARPEPGECVPWREQLKELPEILGDAELCERVWKDIDALAYMYIWHCLESF